MDRCTTHGLATGPDGLCVLCRRERTPRSSSPWIAIAVFGAIAAGLIGAGVVHVVGARRASAPSAASAKALGVEHPAAAPASTSGEWDLAAARRSVEITMFTASWCPHCKHAKAWMAANGLGYLERDVEADPANDADCRRYNPRRSIPTTVVDGEVLIGFGEESYAKAVDEAARRRWERGR